MYSTLMYLGCMGCMGCKYAFLNSHQHYASYWRGLDRGSLQISIAYEPNEQQRALRGLPEFLCPSPFGRGAFALPRVCSCPAVVYKMLVVPLNCPCIGTRHHL
jgi:hypothetical protein